MVLPAHLLGLLQREGAWCTGLVQQNHHRLAKPLQNLHLRCQIACVLRVFR